MELRSEHWDDACVVPVTQRIQLRVANQKFVGEFHSSFLKLSFVI